MKRISQALTAMNRPITFLKESPQHATAIEEIGYLGRAGAMMIRRTNQQWTKSPLSGVQGRGELPMGQALKSQRFSATVEAFHGDKLVVYVACEDLRLRDLDGDGDLDFVAAGRSTHNLKVYWNVQ